MRSTLPFGPRHWGLATAKRDGSWAESIDPERCQYVLTSQTPRRLNKTSDNGAEMPRQIFVSTIAQRRRATGYSRREMLWLLVEGISAQRTIAET